MRPDGVPEPRGAGVAAGPAPVPEPADATGAEAGATGPDDLVPEGVAGASPLQAATAQQAAASITAPMRRWGDGKARLTENLSEAVRDVGSSTRAAAG